MRAFRYLSCVAFLSGAAFSQSFEIADVRVPSTSKLTSLNIFMRGPQARGGRYEIRMATMLDLVSTAYGLDQDKVYGGPAWLELDRYDVIGKLPAGSTPESQKAMLRALLAERFNLKAHEESKPLPQYALTAGKHPLLKESDHTSDQKGCQGKPRPQNIEPGAILPNEVACHNMSMADFADQIHNMAGAYIRQTVKDLTNLKGTYDFDLKWTSRGQLAAAGAEGISVFDAVDKQLGLKLELQDLPTPVVVVDSVNETPTENAPEVATLLAGSSPPTEFEVAEVKVTPADFQGGRFDIKPGGQVFLQGMNLKFIIEQAWGVTDEMLVGAPKWLDTDRFDIIAKAPRAALTEGANGPDMDFDDAMVMLKTLLVQRFKLEAHMEDRPINAYTLMAAKPKLKPSADPNGRIRCTEGPATGGRDPRDKNPILGRLITCQNMTMTRFAGMMQNLAGGYIHAPVLDATGLDGAWDFTLSFSTIGQLQNNGAGRGGKAGDTAALAASDPNGAVSLLDALQKQLGLKLEMTKRPVQVLVIDRMEEKPTDN